MKTRINYKVGEVNANNMTVLSVPFIRDKDRERCISCLCSCGKQVDVPIKTFSKRKSCGCAVGKICAKRNRRGTLAVNGRKVCSQCLVEKEVSNFNFHRLMEDGYHSYCRRCSKNSNLKRLYGIDIERYEEMVSKQDGKCACCYVFADLLYVDHDHKTGAIRGLLCRSCNFGIGLFYDNAEVLKRVIEYLDNSR